MSVIRPIITYAVKSRSVILTAKQLLEPTEITTLRKIMRITKRDHIRSEKSRRMCRIQKMEELNQGKTIRME